MKKDIKSSKSNKLFIIGVVVMVIVAITFFALKYYSNKAIDYKIDLVGNKYLIIYLNEEYIEPGYKAFNKDNIEVTNNVKVVNEINNNIPGIYRVYYQIGNITEYRIVEIKKPLDNNLEIILEKNIEKLTNEDIYINITVNGDTFSSLVLPDNQVIYKNYASFKVTENGIYVFEAFNEKNESFKKEIVINNIDKEAPSGTCVATININDTKVVVDTKEEGIIYNYYDGSKLVVTTDNNEYTFSYKTTSDISVRLEDGVYNSNKINCNIIDNRYHEPIRPNSNEKIVYHGESDSLKAYIVNRGTYHLSYIWVKDAYTQLNKYDSEEYGKNLYRPQVLLEKANNKYNLNNKIMIGFNASGFYLKDTYDADSVRKYPSYDKTSVGTLVITNGQVVRNAYQYAVKTWYTIGVNKDNKLLVFEDSKNSNVDEKKAWSEKVISSGIRNTFTFAAPLLENGQRTNITTSMPGGFKDKKGLQIICQINENNFLLFTSKNESRNKALEEFDKLGCQTAMNLDGGGSVSLLYKDKNSNEIKTVIGGSRSLPEVGFFTE